jgi:hypothetical protein
VRRQTGGIRWKMDFSSFNHRPLTRSPQPAAGFEIASQYFVFFNDAGNLPQIMRPETVIDREPRRRQPEFRILAGFCNVNVRRLGTFFGVEIKLVAFDS